MVGVSGVTLPICVVLLAFDVSCAGDPGGGIARSAGPLAVAAEQALSPPQAPAPRGIPHSGRIIEIALDQEGGAAFTLDEAGGLRFWNHLDGSSEPLMVPGSLANLHLLRTRNGWSAAGIDTAGAAHLMTISDSGSLQVVQTSLPSPRALDAVALGNGELAVLGADHRVRIERGGKIAATFTRRDFRPTLLEFRDRKLHALAASANGTSTEISVATLSWNGLRLQEVHHEQSLSIDTQLLLGPMRLSPTGNRLGLFAATEQANLQQLWILDWNRATATSVEFELPASRAKGGGFVGENSFALTTLHGLMHIELGATLRPGAVEVGPPSNHKLSEAVVQGTTLSAGVADHLYVLDWSKKSDRYLGYRPAVSGIQAISADGKKIAFGDQTMRPRIVDVESQISIPLAGDRAQLNSLAFYGDRHLIGIHASKTAVLYDASSGKVVDEHPVSGTRAQLRGNILLVGDRIFGVSEQGFESIAAIGGVMNTPRLARDSQGEWAVYGKGKTDGKGRLIPMTVLRDGFSAAAMAAIEPTVTSSSHSSTDDSLRTYAVAGGALTRTGRNDDDTMTINLSRTGLSLIQPIADPSGNRVALRKDDAVNVYDGRSGERLWTMGGMNTMLPVWAEEADRVLVPSSGGRGFLVLDGATGVPISAICGLDFSARSAPPQELPLGGVPNLCAVVQ